MNVNVYYNSLFILYAVKSIASIFHSFFFCHCVLFLKDAPSTTCMHRLISRPIRPFNRVKERHPKRKKEAQFPPGHAVPCANLRLVLGGIKNIKGGRGALANVAREASGVMLGILVGEDAKQILDEFSDLISVFAVRVDLLQMGYHVHDIDETVVKNDLLLLELLDQIVDLIDGAFAIDAGISFRNDGVGLLLTQKDVLCSGTLGNLQRTRSVQFMMSE